MDMKQEVLKAAIKNFNVPGFVATMLDGPINAALDEAVKKSATPLDDIAKAALYQTLTKELEKQLQAWWTKITPV